MKKYLLVGYFGFGNIGDEECLRIAAQFLIKECESRIYILSKRGLSEFGKGYSRAKFKDVVNMIKNTDAMILCGGNLIQNETSNLSLIFYCELVRLATLLKRRVYAISSGFGDIYGSIGTRYASDSLQRFYFVGARSGWDSSMFMHCGAHRCRFMPDLSFLISDGKAVRKKTHFALILTKRTRLSEIEVNDIKQRTGLAPLIFVFFGSDDLLHARFLGRILGTKVIKPKSYSEFCDAVSYCAFSICERLHGAIFSFISHTPAYVGIHNAKCRAFVGEIAARGGGNLVIPYTKNDITKIKEVEARDSDFCVIIKSFREELYKEMRDLFL